MADPSTLDVPARGKLSVSGSLGWLWTVLGPFLGLMLTVGLFAYLTRQNGSFLTVYNWRLISLQTVVVGTAALGMTVIMISGGIDLSVGSLVALVCVVMALLAKGSTIQLPQFAGEGKIQLPALPMAVVIVGGTLLGGLGGLLNGSLITRLGVVPFIVTLGSLKVFRGLAKWLSNSMPIYVPNEAKPWWFGKVLATEPEPAWLLVTPGVWVLLALSLT